MDLKITGAFLAQLRKERGLTQEQLGERLGVSNKTVSRWENGNYLPPVEMLQQLSELHGLTINELISGRRMNDAEFKAQADQNIKSALAYGGFTEKERADYFKRKWKKDHLFFTIIYSGTLGFGFLWNVCASIEDWAFFFFLGFLFFWIVRHQTMMAYVESKLNAFEDKKQPLIKRLQVAALIVLGMMIWLTVDLGYNYISSLPAEMNDGITLNGVFAGLIFGDDGWSRAAFLQAFGVSAAGTVVIMIVNIILTCWQKLNRIY